MNHLAEFLNETIENAVVASGEYDCELQSTDRGAYYRRCAKCNAEIEMEGEAGTYADDPPVSVLPSSAVKCSGCSDCVMCSKECAPDGLCPHCAFLEAASDRFERDIFGEYPDGVNARAKEPRDLDDIVGRTLWSALNDLKEVQAKVRKTTDPATATLDALVLSELRVVLDAIISERSFHIARTAARKRDESR